MGSIPRDVKKPQTLKAIDGSRGIMSEIARRLRVDWRTAEKAVHAWKETREAYEAETEMVLDVAEGKIYTAIDDGNLDSCKWYLTKKGRKRGYAIQMDFTEDVHIVPPPKPEEIE